MKDTLASPCNRNLLIVVQLAPDHRTEDWDPSADNHNLSTAAEISDMHIYHNGSSSTPGSSEHQAYRLPRYIHPLPSHIGIDDLEYLAKKDALTLPCDELRSRLLWHYIQYVHPFMPILDLEDFLTRIAQPDRSKPISLLLFQAVMFVSITFVPAEDLHAAGFKSRKSARKTFFQRARLLYGLDCEVDRVSLVQALLLMTYWYENPQDIKDTWHWMGIGLSLAQVLGFHRNPEHLSITDPRAKRMHKRIWWSCFMRDRLLALGIRRPTRIRNEDFNVPMLTLDDFETTPIPQDLLRSVCNSSPLMHDAESRNALAMACIEMAKLCVCIGNVLSSQYTILGDTSMTKAENDARTMVVPRYSTGQLQDMVKCDVELDDWQQNLSHGCRYKAIPLRVARDLNDTKRIVRFQITQLNMIYLTTVSVLHRPRSLQLPGIDGASYKLSKSKVSEAATGISEIVYDLHHQSQLRYLSTSSVPTILWATLSHLTDISSAKDDARFASIGRFYQCMQALEELRDMYASADYAIWFLEAVIKKSDVQIPGLSIGIGANARSTSGNSGSLSSVGTKSTALLQNSLASTIPYKEYSKPDMVITNTVGPYLSMPNGLMHAFTNRTPGSGSGSNNHSSMEQMHANSTSFDGSSMDIDDTLHQAMVDFERNSGQYGMTSTSNSYSGHDLGGLVSYMRSSPSQGFGDD